MVFETARLVVRAAGEEDVDLFYALWTDPRVMKNVGFPEGLPVTRDGLKETLSSQRSSEFDRLLVVQLKATGRAIGECKLSSPDMNGVAEPDVKLLPESWGHRYGVETWRALVDYQFTHTECMAVQATPNVNNIPSIKMQEAVGAVRVSEGVHRFPDSMKHYTTPVPHYVFRLNRSNWKHSRAT